MRIIMCIKMKKYQTYFLSISFIALLLLVIQCGESRFDAELSIFSDRDGTITEEISKELRKSNIPHELDEKGAILYLSSDKNIVRKISKKIKSKYEVNTYIIVNDENWLKAFINLLIQNNIPHQTIDLGNEQGVKILWDISYDSKVKKIKDEFFRGIYSKQPPLTKVENDLILSNLEALLTENSIFYEVVDCHSAVGGKCIKSNFDDYEHIQKLHLIARDKVRKNNIQEP